MMYASKRPAEIYRRVELDARVEGSDGIGLTRLCLDEAIGELDRARQAHARGNFPARNDALSCASVRISALRNGVAQDNPLRGPLQHLYGSAEHAVRLAIANYRPEVLARVRQDLSDIRDIAL